MGFDVVVIDVISDKGFGATGIDNGEDGVDNFTGIGHSLRENLDLACSPSSDHEAWLTEAAFEQASDIRDYVYTRCHGIVSSSYLRVVRIRSHKYEYYFDENSITREFCEHGEHKYDYCEDGTKVLTDECIPPDWTSAHANCDTCVLGGGNRTKVCAEATGDLPAGTEIVTHRCVDGKWVPTGNHCPGAGGGDGCVSGEVHTITCDDGSEIVVERCIGGEWVPTHNTCPDTGGCTADVTKTCPDGSTIVTKRCVDGTLIDTGAMCPNEEKDGGIMAIAGALIGLYLYLRG